MMNYELINKLGSQAQQSVRRQQLVDLDFLAKFAELIVRECLGKVAEAAHARRDPFFAYSQILEHFGVEE